MIPKKRISTEAQREALNQILRAGDSVKQIESDSDQSIQMLAKGIGAEPVPGPPYHAHGNRIERTWEYLCDRNRLQLLQSHVPAFLRPLVLRLISCIFNHIHEVPRKIPGADDGEDVFGYLTPYLWRAHVDGSIEEWPRTWNSSNTPQLGWLINVVKLHEWQNSARRLEPRGTPCMFVGFYEYKGGKPDGSAIAIPLQKVLQIGKISFLRTKEFRVPKTLQFPTKTL